MVRLGDGIRDVMRVYSILLVLFPLALLFVPFFFLSKGSLQAESVEDAREQLSWRADGLDAWLAHRWPEGAVDADPTTEDRLTAWLDGLRDSQVARPGRLAGVFLAAADGRILDKTGSGRNQSLDPAWTRQVLDGGRDALRRAGPDGRVALLIGQPVLGGAFLLVGQLDGQRSMRSFWRLMAIFAGCSLFALTLSAPLGIGIARRLEQPARQLAEAASAIKNGRYDIPLDETAFRRAPEEMRALRQAFDDMRQALAEHIRLLEASTVTDQLTGVSNRRRLVQEGARLVSAAVRAGSPCACLMIDIDHFKLINDTHGHMVGDAMLRHVCAVIASCLRQSDLLARYGGEEFCVLAPNSSLTDALSLGERIRQTVARTPLAVRDLELIRTVSVGVSEYDLEPTFGTNLLEDMIEKADQALYAAKNTGRDRTVGYSPDLSVGRSA